MVLRKYIFFKSIVVPKVETRGTAGAGLQQKRRRNLASQIASLENMDR